MHEKLVIATSPERNAYMMLIVLSYFRNKYTNIRIQSVERNVTLYEIAVLHDEADMALAPFMLKRDDLWREKFNG